MKPGELLASATADGASLGFLLSVVDSPTLEAFNTPLCSCLCNFLTRPTLPASVSCPDSRLPFPSVDPAKGLLGERSAPRSRRRRARWTIKRAAAKAVSLQSGVLSALSCGLPRILQKARESWVPVNCAPRQLACARGLLNRSISLCRAGADPLTGGRADLTTQIQSVFARTSSQLNLPPLITTDAESRLARGIRAGDLATLKADDLDLPSHGASLPVEEYLEPKLCKLWCSPEKLIQSDLPGPTPEPAFCCSLREWARALRRLRRCCMVGVMPLSEMGVAPDGTVPRAGVFALLKASGWLRLIIDRRPWNYWEGDLLGLDLPHASIFTRLILSPGECVRLSLRDASNYYYVLRVPNARLPYQGVGPAVATSWWEAGCSNWSLDRFFSRSR